MSDRPPPGAGCQPTLIVSDLHLGMPAGRDRLRSDARARERLVAALGGIRRLVLLGDVVELRHGPAEAALAAAEPVIGELGRALGEDGEVVLVPGNHDHHLLDAYAERRDPEAPGFGTAGAVDVREHERVAELARALAPARVRVSYPGVWLREDVYALHGHLLDVHTTVPMFERLAAGAMARAVRRLPDGPRSIDDYEGLQAPIYAWIHAVAQTGGPPLGRSSHGASAGAWQALRPRRAPSGAPGRRRLPWPHALTPVALRRRALRTTFAATVAGLNRAGIGPLRAELSVAELRRASLLALGEVLDRLGIEAEHVVFGHTHRAGPLADDDPAEWRGRSGQRLFNTGCWVEETAFLGRDPGRSPYRAGFAVAIEGDEPPVLRNLLD